MKLLFSNAIYVTTSFVGYHNWPDAPIEVEFLRTTHRHLFKVLAELEVRHQDRDLEFFLVKRALECYLKRDFHEKNLGSDSCETIAQEIAEFLHSRYSDRVRMVEVSEDGENGARVWAVPLALM